MLVFTSVMVTPTPGSAPPELSTMFPTSDPFTAGALALTAASSTRAATDSRRCTIFFSLLPRAARRPQLTNPDIAEPHLVAVVLQQDVPLELRAPAGLILELALRLRGLQRRALQLVLDHLHAVQPMLDVHAVDDDPAGVDLARRFQRLVRRRRDRVVERRGLTVRSDQGVSMPGVVDDLVLVRDRTVSIFGHEVLDAAVGAFHHLPLERQVEIVERVGGDDIAAAVAICAFGELFQPSILDNPAVIRKGGFFEAAPAVGRLAVEERALARRGLRRQRRARQCQRGEADQRTSHGLLLEFRRVIVII